MQVQEVAKKVIDKLPKDTTMDAIIHALYVRLKFENGEREIRSGQGVSHEEAKQKLAQWLK